MRADRNGPGPGSPAQRGGRLAQIEADRGASGSSQVPSGSVLAPMSCGGVFKAHAWLKAQGLVRVRELWRKAQGYTA